MKIVIPEKNSFTRGDIDMSGLDKFGKIIMLDKPGKKEFFDIISDADALLMNKMAVDEELLSHAPCLKYVGECATGYNNIDVSACRRRGITVTNIPAYSTNAVSQHTFALILELFSCANKYNDFVQHRRWIESDAFSPFVFPTYELAGKTIGIVGYGRIGRHTAKIASAFGMKVIAYSRSILKKIETGDTIANVEDGSIIFAGLNYLLKMSDIVSIHCPLNDESYGMCGAEFFKKMKPGSYFINTSRGPIVDEAALSEALKSGHIAGAGLDVLTEEPMSASCPLLGIENCIITPHISWAPQETRQRLMDIAVSNLEAFAAGQPENTL